MPSGDSYLDSPDNTVSRRSMRPTASVRAVVGALVRRVGLTLSVVVLSGAAVQAAPDPAPPAPSPPSSASCGTNGANSSDTLTDTVDRYGKLDRSAYLARDRMVDVYRVVTGLAGTAELELGYGNKPPKYVRGLYGVPFWKERDLPAWRAAVQRADATFNTSLTESSPCRALYAARILNKRIDELGASHPYVRQWLDVQETIFKACGLAAPDLPPPLVTDDARVATLQDDDRAFQSAYAAAMPGQGRADFAPLLAVSESQSEHHFAALYLVSVLSGQLDIGAVAETPGFDQFMASLLDDHALSASGLYARQVVGYFQAQSGTVELSRVLWRSIEQDLLTPARHFEGDAYLESLYLNAVIEINSFGISRPADWWLGPEYPEGLPRSQTIAEAAAHSDFAAWILARRSARVEGAQWRVKGQAPTTAWLRLRDWVDAHPLPDASRLAWLPIRAAFDLESEADLWREVERQSANIEVCASAPGVAVIGSLFSEAFRASVMHDNLSGAIAGFRRYPFRGGAIAREAVDAALRYLLERGLVTTARRLRDATEADLGAGWHKEGNETLVRIAEDEEHLVRVLGWRSHSILLEPLSIDAMARLARNADVEADLRASLARVAWVRAWVSSRQPPPQLTELMLALNPKIDQWWQSLAPRAPTDPQRRVVFNLLQTPALGRLQLFWADQWRADDVSALEPDDPSDGNWWCPLDVPGIVQHPRALLARRETEDGRPTSPSADADAALASTYLARHYDFALLQRLAEVPGAPQTLSEEVIAWTRQDGWLAQRMGWVRGTDEALHYAVRATRYGCRRDGRHGAFSRRAFQLLHERYPQSEWTAKTPYWFDRVPSIEDYGFR